MNIKKGTFMLVIAQSQYHYNGNIGENSKEKISDFFSKRFKNFGYYDRINRVFTEKFLNNKEYCEYGLNIINIFAVSLLSCLGEYSNDAMSNYITEDDRQLIIDFSFYTIKYFQSENAKNHLQQIKEYFYKNKDDINVVQEYSYDAAFDVLKSDGNFVDNVYKFIKICLLTDDYYNVERILDIRRILISSEDLNKKCRKIMQDVEPEKDLFSIFFLDFELLNPIIDITKRTLTKHPKDKISATDLLFMVYARFIINMYIYFFESIIIFHPKTKRVKHLADMMNEGMKMDVVLSKIYHRLDLMLFERASMFMSHDESLCFILKLLCDDFCLHEQALLGLDDLNKTYSFRKGLDNTKRAETNSDVFEEMGEIAKKKWFKGCKYGYNKMMNFIWNTGEYKDVLSERGAIDKLKKVLERIVYDFCLVDIHWHGEKEPLIIPRQTNKKKDKNEIDPTAESGQPRS